MPTEKQIAANRRNALKSTGPTSVAGKAASSMNALKTGIHAKSVIVPGESVSDLQHLIEEYYSHYRPADPQARALVDDLIRTEWTLRRLDTSEASLWDYENEQSFAPVPKAHRQGKVVSQNTKALGLLQRRLDATRRGRDRALRQLRDLAAKPVPAPAPQPPAETAEEIAPAVAPHSIPRPVTSASPTPSGKIGFVPLPFPSSPSQPAPEPRPVSARAVPGSVRRAETRAPGRPA